MENTLESSHSFYYSTDNPITAAMLAESLLGLEGVVQNSTQILSKLMGVPISKADVMITSIKLGSYDESFFVRLFFGKGKEGEQNIEKLREKLGLKNMDLKKVVGVAIAAAILYAAWYYVGKSGDPSISIHIENSFNNWGKDLGVSKEELLDLVKESIKKPEDLKKHVVQLTHPEGSKKGGKITIDGEESLTLSPEVVQSIPSEYVKEISEEPFKDFDGVDIVVRAMDLDRPVMGWAAIVPEVSDKRLPLVLEEGILPMTIPLGKYTPADITVIYKLEKNGNKTPKKYLLRRLVEKKG